MGLLKDAAMGGIGSAIGGGIAGAAGGVLSSVGGVIGDALGISGEARKWKYDQKRMDKQFDLNEKAAENAQQRAVDMYKMQYDMNTQQAMRKQMEDAGLSVGLMYGMQGAGGAGGGAMASGAQGGVSGGGNAGNPQALGIDPMTASNIELNNAMANKANAEAEQLKKTGAKTEAETEYTRALTKYAPLDAFKKFLEIAEHGYKLEGTGEYFKFKWEDWEIKIDNQSYTGKMLAADMANAWADVALKGATKDEKVANTAKIIAEKVKTDNDVKMDVARLQLETTKVAQEWKRLGLMSEQNQIDWTRVKNEYVLGDEKNQQGWKQLEQMATKIAHDCGLEVSTMDVIRAIFGGGGTAAVIAMAK